MDKQQQVTDLWRKSFHDSEEFIQFYFAHKYSDENSLVYEENGKALSAFLMLPYPIQWQGTILQTAYISGACTLQEARNHGLMTNLLQMAFQEMYKREIAFSTLVPAEDWLFKYYSNLGYVPVFEYTREVYIPHKQALVSDIKVISPQTADPALISQLFPFFQRKTAERPCSILHPLEDYKAIVEDVYLSGGLLIYTQSNNSNEINGWALAQPEANKINIKEILYQTDQEKIALLETAAQIWPSSSIEYRLPPQEAHQERYGMARITHAFLLLQYMADIQPTLSLALKLNDPQMPENTGIYILSQGKCEKVTTYEHPIDIETDIPTLTQAILGYHTYQLPKPLTVLSAPDSPYMNLMLD